MISFALEQCFMAASAPPPNPQVNPGSVGIPDTHRSTMREMPPPKKKIYIYYAAKKDKVLECSEMARFQIKKIGGRHDGRRFRGHLLLLMSPKTSGVASPVESSNTKK